MLKINLDVQQVSRVKNLANEIATEVHSFVKEHSSLSVERAVLRLYGVNGVDKNGVPLPNLLLERLKNHNDVSSS
ncbi:MAG: D-lysine 5,6-aminomutase subunit alpha, partial [Oligoflexia bacterium]|nr:D-lysine 5,6-aminomutase subunit alpha [Oligoflexia bacterium]